MDAPISPETISRMLQGINRYNPENLAVLEKHVDWQVHSGSYDLPANLAVLKLYQFNPAYFQTQSVCQILLKALSTIPSPDFSLCTSLIDQNQQEDPSIGRLLLLHHLIETCKFTHFWQEVNATPDLISGVAGLEEAVRKFICHVVSVSHQNIDIGDLRAILGDLNEHELEVWIERCGWKQKEGGLISVANHEEKVKTKNIVEKVGFEKVQNVMASTC
ncbi:eukaryotic translation initiation factor 3 subunit K-like [Styela clava]